MPDPQLRRPGLDRRRRLAGWLSTTAATARLARPERPRLRVPRPGPRPEGQPRRLERDATCRAARPTLTGRRVRDVRVDGLSVRSRPDTAAPVVGELRRGDIVAIIGGPVGGRRLHLVPGRRPAPRVGPRSAGSGRRLGRRAPADDARSSDRRQGPERHERRGRTRRGSRSAARWPGLVGSVRGRDRRPGVLAERRRLGATARSTGRTGGPSTASCCASSGRTARSSARRAVPATGSGAQAWAWDGSVGGHRLANGRYLVQLVGTGRGADVHGAVGPAVAAGPGDGLCDHDRHGPARADRRRDGAG